MVTQEKRPKSAPNARIRESADHELCALHALHLEPVIAPPRQVRSVTKFANDSLQAEFSSLNKEIATAPYHVVGISQGMLSRQGRHDLLEHLLALFQRD